MHQNGNTNLAALRLSDGLSTRVTNQPGSVSEFALAPGGAGFAIVVASQTAPPEIARLSADGGLPN